MHNRRLAARDHANRRLFITVMVSSRRPGDYGAACAGSSPTNALVGQQQRRPSTTSSCRVARPAPRAAQRRMGEEALGRVAYEHGQHGYGLTPLPRPASGPTSSRSPSSRWSRRTCDVDVGVAVDAHLRAALPADVPGRQRGRQHVLEDRPVRRRRRPPAPGLQLLELKLKTILRRWFPLSKSPDNVGVSDTESRARASPRTLCSSKATPGSSSATRHWGARSTTSTVQLKSTAPERADLGYALLAQDL